MFSAIDGHTNYWPSWMGFGVPLSEALDSLRTTVEQELKKDDPRETGGKRSLCCCLFWGLAMIGAQEP